MYQKIQNVIKWMFRQLQKCNNYSPVMGSVQAWRKWNCLTTFCEGLCWEWCQWCHLVCVRGKRRWWTWWARPAQLDAEVADQHRQRDQLRNDDEEDGPAESHSIEENAAKGGTCSQRWTTTSNRKTCAHSPTKAPKAKTEVQSPDTSP